MDGENHPTYPDSAENTITNCNSGAIITSHRRRHHRRHHQTAVVDALW